VVESDGAPDDVPIAESTVWPREEASVAPSPSIMVFLLLSPNTPAGRRMSEDNLWLFRLPECSPVGVGGREPVWGLLLLILGVDPVSIVFTTP